jgi:hypothetical protein
MRPQSIASRSASGSTFGLASAARFGEIVEVVATDLTPHKLCTYLYELAGAYSVFYEQCPVLRLVEDADATPIHRIQVGLGIDVRVGLSGRFAQDL